MEMDRRALPWDAVSPIEPIQRKPPLPLLLRKVMLVPSWPTARRTTSVGGNMSIRARSPVYPKRINFRFECVMSASVNNQPPDHVNGQQPVWHHCIQLALTMLRSKA